MLPYFPYISATFSWSQAKFDVHTHTMANADRQCMANIGLLLTKLYEARITHKHILHTYLYNIAQCMCVRIWNYVFPYVFVYVGKCVFASLQSFGHAASISLVAAAAAPKNMLCFTLLDIIRWRSHSFTALLRCFYFFRFVFSLKNAYVCALTLCAGYFICMCVRLRV